MGIRGGTSNTSAGIRCGGGANGIVSNNIIQNVGYTTAGPNAGYIAGKCIPIVVVYGKRWFVDNIERCMGHVRLAKDAQRLKNMQLSKLGEISALSSVEKPILVPEQVAGHQMMWAEDNLKDYPYLLINPITDQNGNQAVSGPVAYTRSAAIPPAMAALLQIT